jgi:ABC-2 type transport system permease protein
MARASLPNHAARRCLWVVALNEWRLLTRTRAYAGLLAGCAVLLLVAAWLGGRKQERERERQRAYQLLVRHQWETQPDRHPHRVAHYGTFAFKPPGPLAAIDPGVDGYAGRSIYLEAHRQNSANFAEAGELSAVARLGELSVAFVLHVVLPLVAVLLGHRALVGEREAGRGRLLLTQGVPEVALAMGKLLGVGLALLPFLSIAGLVAGGLAFHGGAWSLETAMRLAGLAGIVTLHVMAWGAVGVWISSWSRTVAQASGAALGLWLLGMVVLPRAAAVWAERRHPLPDKSAFQAAVSADTRALGDSHDPNDPHFEEFRRATLARFGVTRIEDLPVNYAGIVMARGEQLSAETFARHFARLAETMERQAASMEAWGLVSPYLAARALSAAAAGTDLRSQLHFQRAAEAYRYRFVQALNDLHRDEIRSTNDRDQKVSAVRWLDIPDFQYRPVGAVEAWKGTGVAWSLLGLWLAAPVLGLCRPRLASP